MPLNAAQCMPQGLACEFLHKVKLAWCGQPAQSLPLQRHRPWDLRLEAEGPCFQLLPGAGFCGARKPAAWF